MKYDFDSIIDRRNTNAMSVEGFRAYLFNENDQLDFQCADDEFVAMWIADMEFASPPEVIDAIRDRLNHGIFGYSQIYDPNYKSAFLDWTVSQYNWQFNIAHLYTAKGIIPALFDLVKYICKPDEKVLVFTPSYVFFKLAATYNEVELVTSDLIYNDGEYTIDFEDFKNKAEDSKVTLCIFCSPHNPTGRVWSVNELRQFAQICMDNKVMIISDEIHCDLLRSGKTFTPLAKLFPESDQIITCMAPSKTFNMAGFMIANIIIPNDKLSAIWRKRQLPVNNPLSIVAAQAAYTSGIEWLLQLKVYLDANFDFLKKHLEQYLPKAIFKIPESTYFAWINLEAYLPNEENLTLFFANNAGVLLEGGTMFVANGRNHVRLNLACPRARLKEGLDKITAAILS